MNLLSRRDAIKKVAIMVGGTIALPDILKAWESPVIENSLFAFSANEEALIAEIANVIVPDTDTPGAKAAGVHRFMMKVMADCLDAPDRQKLMDGITGIDQYAQTKMGKGFVDCSEADRIAVLTHFEKEYHDSKNGAWRDLKSLVVTGYFTSEIGCTQALRYEPVPGSYDGAYPYKKGDRAWG